MARLSPLRRATDALHRAADPFDAMTTLLFVAASSDGGAESVADIPPAAEFNEALAAIEQLAPDHLDGAVVIRGLEDVPASAIAEAFVHIRKFLDSPDRERDIFGVAFMEGQSLSAQQAAGAYFTPDSLGQMMVQMNMPEPAGWVLEPACGTGALILASLDQAKAAYGPEVAESITYIGVELDRRSARLARMNMVLAGAAGHSHIFCGNSLTSPLVAANEAQDGALCSVQFNTIIANPPFGTKVRSLEPTEPLVIPSRLLNRPVLVPHVDVDVDVVAAGDEPGESIAA